MNLDGIKTWLVKQVEAAKFAWTIVVVIASIWGYKANLTPIQDTKTIPDVITQRLDNIDKALKELKPVKPQDELVKPLPKPPIINLPKLPGE
jgi:hypothetical protein